MNNFQQFTTTPSQQYLPNLMYSAEYQKIYSNYFNEIKLKKTCNGAGALMLSVLGVQLLAQLVIEFIIIAVGGLDYNNLYNGYSGMEPTAYFILLGLSSLIFCVFPALIYTKIKKNPLSNVLAFKKVKSKTVIALVFAGLCVCMYANFVTQGLSMSLEFFFDVKNNLQSVGTDLTINELILFIISYSLVPCLTEEFTFRGVLLGTLRKYGDGFAIVTTAILFGMLHGNFVQIPFAFIVGLVLGFVVCYTNSMLPAIIIHFFNNFFSVVMTMVEGKLDSKSANIISLSYMLILFIIGIAGFSYLAKNDKKFMTVKNESSEIECSSGHKIAVFLKSGTVITFFIIMLLLAVLMLTMM